MITRINIEYTLTFGHEMDAVVIVTGHYLNIAPAAVFGCVEPFVFPKITTHGYSKMSKQIC